MIEFPDFGPQDRKDSKLRSIGVLTSGGDAPGMNAAIRAVVRYGIAHDLRVYGIQRGYSGLFDGKIEEMSLSSVANVIQRGGTILKTDRCAEFMKKPGRARAAKLLKRHRIDALVVIGGDGSFTGAHLLEMETGIRVMGVPGTIDNDIFGSDATIGFDTAVNHGIEAIDRIRDTASSHDRIFLVEVMGRNTGFIATEVGIGGGAETILLPEHKLSISEICRTILRGMKRGKSSSIIVAAEGSSPGRTGRVAKELGKRGFGAKVAILGHVQRGGSPTAYDRLLASSMGAAAVGYLLEGHSDSMVALQEGRIARVPLLGMYGKKKPISTSLIELAKILAI